MTTRSPPILIHVIDRYKLVLQMVGTLDEEGMQRQPFVSVVTKSKLVEDEPR